MSKRKWINRFNSKEREKPAEFYSRPTDTLVDTATYIPVDVRIKQSQLAGLKGTELQAQQFDFPEGNKYDGIPKVSPVMRKGYDPVELQNEINDLIQRRFDRLQGNNISPSGKPSESAPESASGGDSPKEEPSPEKESAES